MGEVILEKGEVLRVYFVCATAVQSQLFSFSDFLKIQLKYNFSDLEPASQFVNLV